MKIIKELIVEPGKKANISKRDPEFTHGFESKKEVRKKVEANLDAIDALQYRLYAEGQQSLLIVLQGMDSSGKDGTVRHVMSGVSPQGCRVPSFKVPSHEEASHDFLWRVHKETPANGMITIFNRSHYEDVLVVRVHNLVPEQVWSKRFDQINDFERILHNNGTTILKFFLHIDRKEQKRRLEERLSDKTKNWKISDADWKERRYWEQYQRVYEDALTKCSTPWAPWYVIPANKKWFRNYAISSIIRQTLERMNPSLTIGRSERT